MKRALLLSGGMDSTALAWWLRPELAITIDYGQKPAQAEIIAAAEVCKTLGIAHSVLRVDASAIGSGDLVGQVPLGAAPASDWWPYRNQLLITLAGASALAGGYKELLLGTVSTDASHIDGTPEFIARISALMSYQEGGLSVHAPAIDMCTIELIHRSGVPASVLSWSHSCHKANVPCSECRGCYKHMDVVEALGGSLDALA